jgi:histidinol phosphatase-like enzyme
MIEQVHRVNRRLSELLGDGNIDAFYFCPFHPKGRIPDFAIEHSWHKPKPGMILAAATELDLNLNGSWLIGDAPRDIEAGLGAGIAESRCLLIGRDGADIAALAERVLSS